MSNVSAPNVGALKQRDTLRLCTAGSVDDGKSTFVGRLLYDTKSVLAEISISTLSERGATRADDKLSESAMEDRKKEGYF